MRQGVCQATPELEPVLTVRMQEMHEDIIATIPQTQDEDTVLEVAMTYDAANRACVELRHLAWANGIGWYRQKTLSLDASAAEALLKSLGQVRRRLNPREPAQADRKVIPFPVVRTQSEMPRPMAAQGLETLAVEPGCCERFRRKGRACKKCPTMASASNQAYQEQLQMLQKV